MKSFRQFYQRQNLSASKEKSCGFVVFLPKNIVPNSEVFFENFIKENKIHPSSLFIYLLDSSEEFLKYTRKTSPKNGRQFRTVKEGNIEKAFSQLFDEGYTHISILSSKEICKKIRFLMENEISQNKDDYFLFESVYISEIENKKYYGLFVKKSLLFEDHQNLEREQYVEGSLFHVNDVVYLKKDIETQKKEYVIESLGPNFVMIREKDSPEESPKGIKKWITDIVPFNR